MTISNYPNGFPNGVNIQGLPVLNSYGGNVYWVDSGAGSDSHKGTFQRPFGTIDYAIGRCTANNGDIIMVKPGHSESPTSSIAADVAGVTIVGLGIGTDMATVNSIATDEAIDVSAANVTIKSLRFPSLTSGTQSGTRKVTVDAAHCHLEGNRFECGASDDNAVYVTVDGDDAFIYANDFVVTANGPDTAIMLEGADGGDTLQRTIIKQNFFNGGSATNSWDEGVIYSSGVHTECNIEENRFLFMSGGVGGVEFTAAATGMISNNYFAGGTLGQMLDPGSCYCFENYEADAIDERGRAFPTSAAS